MVWNFLPILIKLVRQVWINLNISKEFGIPPPPPKKKKKKSSVTSVMSMKGKVKKEIENFGNETSTTKPHFKLQFEQRPRSARFVYIYVLRKFGVEETSI